MKVAVYNLEWSDPPAADDAVIQGILIQLQTQPGRWARICVDRSQTALVAKWQKLGTEARHHRTNPGQAPARYDIYVRWPKEKTPTVSQAVREEAAKVRQAVTAGTALTPPPKGGYLAQRAARQTPAGGNPL